MNRRSFLGLIGKAYALAVAAPVVGSLLEKTVEPFAKRREWHKFGFKYDPQSGKLVFYVDGLEQSVPTPEVTHAVRTRRKPVGIGYWLRGN